MNPFPGLRPFRADEAALFVGREIVQGSLTTRVRITPLTVMVARSGVGKSSFLTCRVIPKLQETSAVQYLNEWGGASADALIDREVDAIERGRSELEERPLLVLDQFEDVFKLPSPRDALWEKLAELVNVPDSAANVLISMREEWLGAWGESADYLPAALNSVIRLAPLTDQELKRAIRRPPEVEGTVSVEPELIGQLIRDLRRPTAYGLGDGYVEPGLLQLVCHRLWTEASQMPERRMTLGLYNRLGGADRISREFVWNELGYAGTKRSHFSSFDRVLWAGMTRHLVVAQGIKAITDPRAMARKMRMQDLGFAGLAVTQARLPKPDREYLMEMPERRGEPPQALVSWISDVVDKGVQVGFLKQQHGLLDRGSARSEPAGMKNLFEISHDALSDLFQQFSVEFECWVRARWAKLLGVAGGGLIGLPLLVYSLVRYGILSTLYNLGTFVLGLAIYILFLLGLVKIAELLFRGIGYPVVRRLARGGIPLPMSPRVKPSGFREKITRFARMLGFMPR